MPPFQESNPKADIVRLLIDHGADVTAQDETHLTPLHHAAFWGNVETVRLLIQQGADVTAQDSSKTTPLHLASSTVSSKTLLLQYGTEST
jgi:ankyrin repeat protein